jgi:hypothetical protein
MSFLAGLLATLGAIQAIRTDNNDERRTGLILVGAGIICGILGAMFNT